mmetsp:Transcript_22775/g.52482  ORF Transcript_22775/g.52482 Transcript_22775/m.52482 type:complete len:357 (-) Transcript_22775:836-1906(-)
MHLWSATVSLLVFRALLAADCSVLGRCTSLGALDHATALAAALDCTASLLGVERLGGRRTCPARSAAALEHRPWLRPWSWTALCAGGRRDEREHGVLDRGAVIGTDRVEAEVADEGAQDLLLGTGLPLLGRLEPNQLRVRHAQVAEVMVGQRDAAVERHVARLLVHARGEQEHVALVLGSGTPVCTLQNLVWPVRVGRQVVIARDDLLPAAVDHAREGEPRQQPQRAGCPFVRVDVRAAAKHLRRHAQRPQLVRGLPRAVRLVHTAAHEDGPPAVVGVEKGVHQEGARRSAVRLAGEGDVSELRSAPCAPHEPRELHVVLVDHGDVWPHAQKALHVPDRVEDLVPMRQEQHRLLRG